MFCFASCTDDYTDWANPLTNGPEDSKTVMMTVLLAEIQAAW